MTAVPAAAVPALAAAWAGLVVLACWPARPAPRRLRALAPAPGGAPDGGAGRGPARPGPAEVLGAALRRLARRPVDPVAARRTGVAVLATLPALVVLPAAAVPVGATVWAWPAVRRRRAAREREEAVRSSLPEVVDLLVLAVGAGLTVPLAVGAVARRGDGPVAAELGAAAHDVAVGRRLADALDDAGARLGDAGRPLVGLLVASERYGAPLLGPLERLAVEVRAERRRAAEEAARRVPVKLLFPLVLCTLPAFALLTLAPLLAGAAQQLRP